MVGWGRGWVSCPEACGWAGAEMMFLGILSENWTNLPIFYKLKNRQTESNTAGYMEIPPINRKLLGLPAHVIS